MDDKPKTYMLPEIFDTPIYEESEDGKEMLHADTLRSPEEIEQAFKDYQPHDPEPERPGDEPDDDEDDDEDEARQFSAEPEDPHDMGGTAGRSIGNVIRDRLNELLSKKVGSETTGN